ncbi:hypothetical protein Peur_069344 [Populus x canadensis]
MVEIPPQQICLPWYLCPRISICLPWYPCPRISFCMVNKLWFTVHLLSDTEAKSLLPQLFVIIPLLHKNDPLHL